MLRVLPYILLLSSVTVVYGQKQLTENTLSLSGENPGTATIEDIAWIAGHWSGEAFGGVGEEIWSKPMGKAMMGSYRIVQNDTVIFYEMMIIREVDESILLQIKHFNPNLTGWEEKDESEEFQFIKKEGNRVYLDGFTFEKNDEDNITLYVAIKNDKDGTIEEYVFPYKRKSVIN